MKIETYIGRPCRKFGHTLRYKSTGACVECERKNGKLKREKYKDYHKNYRKENKEKLKSYIQKWRYGIDFNELLKLQDFKCAICKEVLDLGKRTHMDHSGIIVRGVLCHLCNVGLGHFRDNENYLLEAVEYLRKHKIKNTGWT